MQFRKAGNKIQILAYAGYSKEKRRSVVQVIGTLDRYSPSLTDDLKNKLTVEQQKEVTEWIDQRRKADDLAAKQATALHLDSSIIRLADSLTSEEVALSDEQAARLYDAMATLQKALKKCGHRKPTRAPAIQPSPALDPAQSAIPFPPLADGQAGEHSDPGRLA